jgi:hypothetical protein
VSSCQETCSDPTHSGKYPFALEPNNFLGGPNHDLDNLYDLSLVAVVICLYTQERNILKTGRTHLRPYSEDKYIDI